MITMSDAVSVEEFEWLLKSDEMFSRIAEDGISKEDFKIPFDGNQRYKLIEKNGEIIGVWIFYPVNSSTLNIHANMLKKYRKYAGDAVNLALNWFCSHSPDQYVKLNAEIPVIYEDVYKFTKRAGFTDEGLNRLSILKNGKLVDQYRLGLTRSEASKIYGGES